MLKGDAPPTRKEFAKRLRNRRRDAGYRHARHFAKAIGVSETRYTKWERAETEPDITHINKLAGAAPNVTATISFASAPSRSRANELASHTSI